ncbi:hypothetical protein BOTBODRAFT_172108 [Botryobasidium botryosum FD-172 SS1]|uniref:Uncharacterized protein n=1 Tax=Botryobasidium botryosum (strain FD-172 SS1) TaxID=930990 RepID=A0A067MQ19_BOTB1|nr:hypothetical protein BOTBODRAFT_172108 [Botryobasidium botryosum FD-172 SS1]
MDPFSLVVAPVLPQHPQDLPRAPFWTKSPYLECYPPLRLSVPTLSLYHNISEDFAAYFESEAAIVQPRACLSSVAEEPEGLEEPIAPKGREPQADVDRSGYPWFELYPKVKKDQDESAIDSQVPANDRSGYPHFELYPPVNDNKPASTPLEIQDSPCENVGVARSKPYITPNAIDARLSATTDVSLSPSATSSPASSLSDLTAYSDSCPLPDLASKPFEYCLGIPSLRPAGVHSRFIEIGLMENEVYGPTPSTALRARGSIRGVVTAKCTKVARRCHTLWKKMASDVDDFSARPLRRGRLMFNFA